MHKWSCPLTFWSWKEFKVFLVSLLTWPPEDSVLTSVLDMIQYLLHWFITYCIWFRTWFIWFCTCYIWLSNLCISFSNYCIQFYTYCTQFCTYCIWFTTCCIRFLTYCIRFITDSVSTAYDSLPTARLTESYECKLYFVQSVFCEEIKRRHYSIFL